MQEVSGRFDIQDLLAGYCYAVVTRDFGLLDSIFTTDAIIDYSEMVGVKGSLARRNQLRANSRRAARALDGWLAQFPAL